MSIWGRIYGEIRMLIYVDMGQYIWGDLSVDICRYGAVYMGRSEC
jgi:hypothetical protein